MCINFTKQPSCLHAKPVYSAVVICVIAILAMGFFSVVGIYFLNIFDLSVILVALNVPLVLNFS